MRYLPSDPQEHPYVASSLAPDCQKVGANFLLRTACVGSMAPGAKEDRGFLMHRVDRMSWSPGAIIATGLVWAALFAGAWALNEGSRGSSANSALGLAPGQSVAVDASAVVPVLPMSHPAVPGITQVPALPALRPRKAASRPAPRVAAVARAQVRSAAVVRSAPATRFRAPVRPATRAVARSTTPTAPARTAPKPPPTTIGTGTVSGGG
jgi:hypothetical protein